MAVIAILGTSGVGKSFLVKQLSSYHSLPCFLEGEEGTIPGEILEDVFSGEDSRDRFDWFGNHYEKILRRAHTVSDAGLDCFIDVAPMTVRAVMVHEDQKHHSYMEEIAQELDDLAPGKILLLTASEEKLREFISDRGRDSEEVGETLKRAVKVQDKFVELSEEREDVIVLDRTELEFTDREDLELINEKLGK